MFGEVEGSRSGGLPRAKPKGGSLTLRKFEGSAFLSRQPSATVLQFCSSHRSSRMCSNSLKTNDGCHVYPSRNREDDFPGFRSLGGEKIHSSFFTAAIRSKLARAGSVQESRSRWLAHRSR